MSGHPNEPLMTDAEARVFRRFVRRETLPWFAGALAFALLLAGVSFALATHLAEPAIAPRPLERAGSGGVSPAELASLRDELASLRGELEAGLAANRRDLASVEKELGETSQSIETLRGRISKAEKAVKAKAARSAGPELAAGDADALRQRLSNLEKRQDDLESKRATFAKDVLNRLYAVETGRDHAEATRLESDEKARARLRNLEERFSQIEARLGAPAAPAP